MIKGTTKSGFVFEIDETVMDNMELVDLIAESDTDNPLVISKIAKLILGKEMREKLYDHLRTEDGRVPTQLVFEAIGEIFTAFGQPGKNS